MAKWGQGDPRWIVEEREDGTNVNNWHGTERDATRWSKGKLRDLLVGIVVENEAGRVEISELKQVEVVIKESGEKHKGLIEILNLSEENEVDDTENLQWE
nr:activator of 90 kDa heat shock protein ATPase homolog 2-like [Mirounga angustirostris]